MKVTDQSDKKPLGSNPKQRAFWLGEAEGFDRAFIEKNYRSLKPCLHGSDAHKEEDVTVADLERFCWIKGDLTFETLRQAVIEPADRVRIAAQPPVFINPAGLNFDRCPAARGRRA